MAITKKTSEDVMSITSSVGDRTVSVDNRRCSIQRQLFQQDLLSNDRSLAVKHSAIVMSLFQESTATTGNGLKITLIH
eukprot:scaffold16526_cov94-Skeletonema_dohrnii-CCMP3373.AAC.1